MRVLYNDANGQLTLQEVNMVYWDKDENACVIIQAEWPDLCCKDFGLKYKIEELLKQALKDGFLDLSEYVFYDDDDEEG